MYQISIRIPKFDIWRLFKILRFRILISVFLIELKFKF